jgi:Putative zinc-finger
MSEITCAQLKERSAELALGVLSGRERAEAIAHLERCPACRSDVRSFTVVADQLLEMVPGTEPPWGFEQRVLRRLRKPGSRRRGRLLRSGFVLSRRHLAAAAALIAVAVGTAGWAIGSASQQERKTPLLTGAFTTTRAGHAVWAGEVFAYTGSHPWVYMTVNVPSAAKAGTIWCRLLLRHGGSVEIGSFSLQSGEGYWSATVPVPPSMLAGAQIYGPGGASIATASFHQVS